MDLTNLSSNKYSNDKVPLIRIGSLPDIINPDASEETPLHNRNITKYEYGGIEDGLMPNRRIPASTTNSPFQQSAEGSVDLQTVTPVSNKKIRFHQAKTSIVFLLVIIMSGIIAFTKEDEENFREFSVSLLTKPTIEKSRPSYASGIVIYVRGQLLYSPSSNSENLTLQVIQNSDDMSVTKEWNIIVSKNADFPETKQQNMFDLMTKSEAEDVNITIRMTTDSIVGLPVGIDFDFVTVNYRYQVVFAGVILILVYVLIIFELVHRALAAILGSLATLAVMSSFNQRPSLEVIISWLDFETLILLFGMMLIVSIFAETGFFDWIALQAYKLAKGKVWPLLIILCLFAAVISAFLDNVTTILLLSPVTIRLCEALRMDPRRILVAEVIFANIGGTATAVGDPPNVIIASSSELQEKGVNFVNFSLHMSFGILFVLVTAFGLLFILYRDLGKAGSEENYELIELHREVEVWKRQAYSITIASKEEATIRALLLQKVFELEHKISVKKHQKRSNQEFRQTIEEMEHKYRITNRMLLIKCGFVMVVVIVCFFISTIDAFHLDLGWIAFLGGIWLLVLADFAEMESLLDRVEWATLIFFAALFALMEALEKLGLISYIGDLVSNFIISLPTESQLPVAILTILWVSSLASSFIDNIPFTTAMIPIIIQLGNHLPILPLVWSLAFGACLGGNGTLIGASANVVAAGIAQQHGYGFNFLYFFKVGFPMMLWTTFVAMIYLLISHCAVNWNYN